MNQFKTKTLIAILTAAIMLLIPIVALAIDPPALVPKTGDTICYDAEHFVIPCEGTGQDGECQTGVASPNPRFTDNGDGTVADEKTGLVWLKNTNCFGTRLWIDAIMDSNGLNSGECGLTDASVEGDWRLPNRFELESLLDLGNTAFALPTGHPFTNIQVSYYWSSTTVKNNADTAWTVSIYNAYVYDHHKPSNYYNVLPVRGPDRDDDGLQDHEDNCPTVANPDQKDVDSNNIGDVCDPNTVYGKISGDIQEGVSIEISVYSCGQTNPVATTTTDSDGYYAFGSLSNANYAIMPQNTSYVFNPVTRSAVIPQGSIHAYNFVATAIYTISGTVSGDIQEGIIITLSGDSSATTYTESGESYSFTGLPNGSYTITPNLFGYTFEPESVPVELVDANVTDIGFTANYILTCDDVDRFLDNNDGTVTDCRTNLVWLKNANCYGRLTWDDAVHAAFALNSGECGLSDGSSEGDWHLATKDELQGIGLDPPITWDEGFPPTGTWTTPGSPFFSGQSFYYWSSSTIANNPGHAWSVVMSTGYTYMLNQTNDYYVWPVRSAD